MKVIDGDQSDAEFLVELQRLFPDAEILTLFEIPAAYDDFGNLRMGTPVLKEAADEQGRT